MTLAYSSLLWSSHSHSHGPTLRSSPEAWWEDVHLLNHLLNLMCGTSVVHSKRLDNQDGPSCSTL